MAPLAGGFLVSTGRLARSGLLALVAAAAVGCAGREADAPMQTADLVLLHGSIHTLEPGTPRAEALAVLGDRILRVGTDAEIEPLAGNRTRRIDLGGRAVIPGLIDAHLHVKGIGKMLAQVDLRGAASAEAAARKVAEAAALAAGDSWIEGRGWDQNLWPGGEFPTAAILDSVSGSHPVSLRRVDGHALWVNTKALEAAGVGRATPDPRGGRILRHPGTAVPTGVLIDDAMDLVEDRIPEPSLATRQIWIETAGGRLLASGITSVHDAGIRPEEIELYKRMVEANRLPVRVYAMLGGSNEKLPDYFGVPRVIGYGDRRFTFRSLKLGVDGALGSRGAALLAPYEDDPKNWGLVTMPRERLEGITREALRRGFQVCVHAIGDRANRMVLDAFDSALAAVPSEDPRLRIEHAQILAPADIPRLAHSGILASMQPVHATADMPWVPARIGEERAAGAYAWRSLAGTGTRLAFGSDAPVELWNPFHGLHAAVTRRDRDGRPDGGWLPEERLTREEALRAFTIGAAYAAFEEDQKGTLRAGKLADFVVLDRDYFEVPEDEIWRITPEMTFLGGKQVFGAEGAQNPEGGATGRSSGEERESD
jgi:hypothetical protein